MSVSGEAALSPLGRAATPGGNVLADLLTQPVLPSTYLEQLARSGELANVVTHGLGMVMSCLALVPLFSLAMQQASLAHLAAVAIYGTTLVLLYASSTLYHGTQQSGWKERFRVLDHVGIYAFIAGSYTPFCLLALGGVWGRGLLIATWSLATVGIARKVVYARHESVAFSTLLYVLLGWLALFAVGPLYAALSADGFFWLVAGGVCYTGGVYFFMHENRRLYHAIWHLFVLAGTACHYWAMLESVFV